MPTTDTLREQACGDRQASHQAYDRGDLLSWRPCPRTTRPPLSGGTQARRSAITARADTQRQIKALIISAADHVRTRLCSQANRELIEVCAAARPANVGDAIAAVTFTLRALARRLCGVAQHHSAARPSAILVAVRYKICQYG